MDSIVKAFTSLPSAKAKKDDDFSDRLSSRYTVLLLIIFAIVVSIMHNMWDPIKCWAPVHFTGNHVKYTNSYCWVRNTFLFLSKNWLFYCRELIFEYFAQFCTWAPNSTHCF